MVLFLPFLFSFLSYAHISYDNALHVHWHMYMSKCYILSGQITNEQEKLIILIKKTAYIYVARSAYESLQSKKSNTQIYKMRNNNGIIENENI